MNALILWAILAQPTFVPATGCAIERDAHGDIARGEESKREYRRHHACPSTGRFTGPCPGWVLDHIWPLCAGGCDVAANLQWQRVELQAGAELSDSSAKDALERLVCGAKQKQEVLDRARRHLKLAVPTS